MRLSAIGGRAGLQARRPGLDEMGFTGCGKMGYQRLVCIRAWLQPCRKAFRINRASAQCHLLFPIVLWVTKNFPASGLANVPKRLVTPISKCQSPAIQKCPALQSSSVASSVILLGPEE